MKIAGRWFLAICAFLAGSAQAAYFEVSYPPSNAVGELPPGVTYTVWIPDGVAKIRAVIVHQHGCGTGACKGGATAAYDLHWQALARKWDAALLGPSYQQEEKQSCLAWCDPRNGSAKAFLKALEELAGKSRHPELATAPWCLWGHSGGGFWSSLMQTMYPERIVAIWFRSGTAFSVWEKETIAKPELTEAVYAIPAMCNPGAKEEGDPRFQGAWTGALAMFEAYRAKGAPIGFAPDPLTAHQCGDCRYLAIPFFDVCLAMRLPEKNAPAQLLRPIDQKSAWLATVLTDKPEPAAAYQGRVDESVWLPNEAFARAWSQYVRTGAVSDTTPPSAPGDVRLRPGDLPGTVEITWTALADFESGLQAFVILRDGCQIARLPEKPVTRFGRPLFQTMSYHDTPEAPIPPLRYLDSQVAAGEHVYQVIAVNSVGLQSPPSAPAKIDAKSPPPPAQGATGGVSNAVPAKFRMPFVATDRNAAVAWQTQARKNLFELVAAQTPRHGVEERPLDFKIHSAEDRGDYTFHRASFQGNDGSRCRCAWTVPKARGPIPAMLCLHGHTPSRSCQQTNGNAVDAIFDAKTPYHGFADRLARGGYCVLAPCLPHRTYAASTLWDLVRCVDVLATRSEVDPKRIGVMGLSMGGEWTMWAAACDERLRVAVVSGWMCTTKGVFSVPNCPCWKLPGLVDLMDICEVHLLIAPRPVLFESAEKDNCFPVRDTQEGFARIRKGYEVLGAGKACIQDVFPGVHEVHGKAAYPLIDSVLGGHAADKTTASSNAGP